MIRKCITLTFAAAFLCAFSPELQAGYAITDLGNGMPTAINASGEVTGNIVNNTFLYDGTVHQISPPVGYYSAYAASINSSGVIGGSLSVGVTSFPADAFYYNSSYHVLASSQTSLGSGINDSGHMVGFHQPNGAWISTDGVNVVDFAASSSLKAAFAINSQDQVTGEGNGGLLFYSGGVEADIATPGGKTAAGYAISNSGYIVGDFYNPKFGLTDGFLYASGSFYNLPTFGGQRTTPRAVNDSGIAVGDSLSSVTGSNLAFIYDGTFTDLNSLIDPSSGWTLKNATGINDAGQIVGSGFLNGTLHGFILTPTPEPGSLSAVGVGALLLIRRRSRSHFGARIL